MKQKKNKKNVYDEVMQGRYLKASIRALRKYLEEVNKSPYHGETDLEQHALLLRLQIIAKLEAEIQRKKDVQRNRIVATAKFCAKFFLFPVAVLIAVYFLLRPFYRADQERTKIQELQTQPQQKPLSMPAHSGSQINEGKSQEKQKTK